MERFRSVLHREASRLHAPTFELWDPSSRITSSLFHRSPRIGLLFAQLRQRPSCAPLAATNPAASSTATFLATVPPSCHQLRSGPAPHEPPKKKSSSARGAPPQNFDAPSSANGQTKNEQHHPQHPSQRLLLAPLRRPPRPDTLRIKNQANHSAFHTCRFSRPSCHSCFSLRGLNSEAFLSHTPALELCDPSMPCEQPRPPQPSLPLLSARRRHHVGLLRVTHQLCNSLTRDTSSDNGTIAQDLRGSVQVEVQVGGTPTCTPALNSWDPVRHPFLSKSFPVLCSIFLCQLLRALLELQCLVFAVLHLLSTHHGHPFATIPISIGEVRVSPRLSDWGSRACVDDHVVDRDDQFFVRQCRAAESQLETCQSSVLNWS